MVPADQAWVYTSFQKQVLMIGWVHGGVAVLLPGFAGRTSITKPIFFGENCGSSEIWDKSGGILFTQTWSEIWFWSYWYFVSFVLYGNWCKIIIFFIPK